MATITVSTYCASTISRRRITINSKRSSNRHGIAIITVTAPTITITAIVSSKA